MLLLSSPPPISVSDPLRAGEWRVHLPPVAMPSVLGRNRHRVLLRSGLHPQGGLQIRHLSGGTVGRVNAGQLRQPRLVVGSNCNVHHRYAAVNVPFSFDVRTLWINGKRLGTVPADNRWRTNLFLSKLTFRELSRHFYPKRLT